MVFLFGARTGMTNNEEERIRHSTFDVPRPTGVSRASLFDIPMPPCQDKLNW